MSRRLLMFAVVALLVAPPALLADLNVELRVTDGANATDADACPVSVGVPLSKGAYEDTTKFRVVDADGKDVPAQFDVMGRYWPDSFSIRGLLVSFNAKVARGGVVKYTLRDDGRGNAPAATAPGGGLKIDESANAVTVVTGPLKVAVRKGGFNVLDKVWLDDNGDGQFADGELIVNGSDKSGAVMNADNFGSAQKDLAVSWDYRGPMMAVLKVESVTPATPDGWGFICRLHFHAGQPTVMADYTLKNSAYGRGGHQLTFDSFTLAAPLANVGDATVRVGGALADNAGAAEGALAAGAGVLAGKWKSYAINGQAAAGLAVGYVDVSDASRGAMVAVRKLSYLWPCGLSVSADKSIVAQLWPKGDGPHELVDMARRSHQVLYLFHGKGWDQGRLFASASLFQRWPVVFLPPAWYSATRAFFDGGGVVSPVAECDPKAFGRYPDYPADKDNQETGWQNWGGANWRRMSSTTGGMPGDLNNVMASGRPESLYRGDDIARHGSEMRPMWCDGYEYPRDTVLGFNASYPPNVGLRKPPGAKDYPRVAYPNWSSWDIMHSWVYEVGDYYWYTGEKFCRDYLVMHADYTLCSSHYPGTGGPGQPQPGWQRETAEPMRIIIDAYKITGYPRYWNYIQAFAENLVDTYVNWAGCFNGCGFQHGLMSATAWDIYFLLPERTDAERVLKERLLQMILGASNGQFWWGGNVYKDADEARRVTWGWGYYWPWSNREKYKRPEAGSMTTQCLNDRGLCYLLTGQEAYRDSIGLVHGAFKPDKPGSVPKIMAGYGRVSSAAYHYARELHTAAVPPPITDLKAEALTGKDTILKLTWTGPKVGRVVIFASDKPIVDRDEKFADGKLALPVTAGDEKATDVYQARVMAVVDHPGGEGQARSVTVTFPSSARERNFEDWAWVGIEAVNAAGPVDHGRTRLSNCVRVEKAKELVADRPYAPTLLKASCQSDGLLYAVLADPAIAPGEVAVTLTNLADGKALPVSKVEIETTGNRLLAIHTEGLADGGEYRLTVKGLGSAGNTVLSFVAHVGPDRFSPVHRVNFGPAVDDWQMARDWDGVLGYNYPMWQWGSQTGKFPANADAVAAKLDGTNVRLAKAAFGQMVFKLAVNPYVSKYHLKLRAGDAGAWPPKTVSLAVEGQEVWNNQAVGSANKKFVDYDADVTVSDGQLDVQFNWLNWLELTADYQWKELATGK
ncbi:MAG: hypothetical protein BIFFINMI_01426 [Phycisphaerae bacterium]|nr:hypothetical protein [Phycisphaerae bacterium]